MYRLTIKGLWAHKVRFALTGLAVVLGVAFMAGTMILTDTMGKTFDDMFDNANQGIDVVVQQPSTVEGDIDIRERVPASTVDTIRAIEGVEAAHGSIQGFAQLVKADGTVSSLDGLGATIGTNWVANEELNPFSIASGQAPEGPDDVVLDQGTLDAEGWELGDTVTVLTQTDPRELTIVGTASFGEVDGLPGSSLVAVSDATAQELFAEPGAYDMIAVSAADGVTSTELAALVDETLGAGQLDVVTGEQDTADKQSEFQEDLSFFNNFLLAFAYIALFVGTFIIYNTFSIVVAQRTKDMAMLRAIGASRRQLLASIMVESTVVGIVAALIGLGGGVLLSFGLRALLGAVGLDIPSGSVVITSGTVVTAMLVGLTVTVLSAVAPAVRGSRVRPIAALRDQAIDRSGSSLRRTLSGLVLTAAGVVTFASGMVAEGSQAMMLLGLGAVGVILGVFVLGPIVATPVMRVLGVPATYLSGATGRLAVENVKRNPKRTAATASALMIGVALVGFITILAASTKASVESAIDNSFRADFVIDSGSWGEGGFNTSLDDQVQALPEVETTSPFRSTPVEIDGNSAEVGAVETATIDELFDLKVSSGDLASVEEGSIAVKADRAVDEGLAVGDTLAVTFPRTGAVDLTVGAIYDEQIAGGGDGDFLVDLSTFEANVTDQFDLRVYVKTVSGVDAETSFGALEGLLSAYPNAELQDQAAFKEGITSEIDTMLNLIYGLLALAVIIALIGIANTLALSIHERTRELGLLRAVGMSRRQVRTSVRWESVLIALLGTALGAMLAVLGAWGIVQALADEDVTTFAVPIGQLAVIIALAGIAGVVAALGPARRAAGLNVLAAISAE